MALRFIDGFDLITTRTDYGAKWTNYATSDSYLMIGTGRSGSGKSLRFYSASGFLEKILDDQSTWITGFAFKYEALPTSNSAICSWYDSANGEQLTLTCDTSGNMSLRRGSSSGTILMTASAPLVVNTWVYIELKVTINNTTGSAELRINGTTVASISGVDTQYSSTLSTARRLRLNGSNVGYSQIDDLYVCDGTGSTNNTFLGDCRVDALSPNAAGTYTDFTPVGGVNNWENVAGALPLETSNYNTADTVGAADSFALPNLSALSSTIFGVQSVLSAKKDDAGARSINARLRLASTDYDGAAHSLGDSYAGYMHIWETNPNTSTAWTESDINGMELGYEVAA